MRKSLLVAGLLVVGIGTAGCLSEKTSGDDFADAPDNASVEDFCATWNGLGNGDVSPSELVDKLMKVGTPSPIPPDARQGFEVFVALADEAGDDASNEDIAALGDGLSDADERRVTALFGYAATVCS